MNQRRKHIIQKRGAGLLAGALSFALWVVPTKAATDQGQTYADLFLIYAIFFLVTYMIPTAIAFIRRHPNRWVIALINIAFGGTGIGWFAALIWALSAVHRSPTGSNGGESGLNLFVNDPTPVVIVPPFPTAPITPVESVEQTVGELKRLKALRDQDLVTAEEYESLRHDLVAKLQGVRTS